MNTLRRLHAVLRPRGYLILRTSEGLADATPYFKMVQCSPYIIYQAL